MQHVTASHLFELLLCLCAITAALSQQECLSGLDQQVLGTTYSARQENISRLVQGYHEDPYPQGAQQEWLSGLIQQVFGTTYSARQDNSTRLIQGYYEDPYPQGAPPAAVVVARGNDLTHAQFRQFTSAHVGGNFTFWRSACPCG